MASRMEVQNVNHPGQVRHVNGAIYARVKQAMLAALPRTSPGLTCDELRERLGKALSVQLFAGGAKVGWWAKTES